jgi:hypothetical protein
MWLIGEFGTGIKELGSTALDHACSGAAFQQTGTDFHRLGYTPTHRG